jgi:uncharacterized protein (TIGR03435 family)
MTFRLLALLTVAALPAVPQVRFEVASIRLSRSDAGPRDARKNFHGDRFDAEASTVGDILDMLNGWQLYRVSGGPGWMRTDRYDIHAKASAEIPPAERKGAIMALLAERFQLVSHHETREITSMALLAPKKPVGIKPAAGGESSSLRFGQRGDPTFTAAPMAALTNYLSNMWHSPVVDQTGLEGTFDFSFEPSAIDPQPGEAWGDRVLDAVIASGFKVETKKLPMEVTVIDRCERPSEN